MIHTGDCLEVMRTMPDASVDSVVTDPPYGIRFMGKSWDHGVPAVPFWAEMLRLAKPGAYLLSFGGTRTVHRIATNIEDAGWIIRDMLVWCYASGFPKGRANLKPAWEPIVMARKPGPLQPLAIDECRIPLTGEADREFMASRIGAWSKQPGWDGPAAINVGPRTGELGDKGRWPSNVLLSDAELFDQPNDEIVGSGATASSGKMMPTEVGPNQSIFGQGPGYTTIETYGDVGGYSRFFIVPKADRAEREPVLDGLVATNAQRVESGHATWCEKCGLDRVNVTPQSACSCDAPQWSRVPKTARANTHPTVKPLDLMRHLIRLVTPRSGLILDPFAGSGSTLIAAELEGFPWIGIEKEESYVAIAEARLNGTQRGLGLDVPAPTRKRTTPPDAKMPPPKWTKETPGFTPNTHLMGDEEPAA